jgi:hypothetical protein
LIDKNRHLLAEAAQLEISGVSGQPVFVAAAAAAIDVDRDEQEVGIDQLSVHGRPGVDFMKPCLPKFTGKTLFGQI